MSPAGNGDKADLVSLERPSINALRLNIDVALRVADPLVTVVVTIVVSHPKSSKVSPSDASQEETFGFLNRGGFNLLHSIKYVHIKMCINQCDNHSFNFNKSMNQIQDYL